jgi:carbon storage regulator CsrA
MLVLSRHVNDSVIFDLREHGLGIIEVAVVDIRGSVVRLGITADRSISVDRHEVFDTKERERNEGEIP